MSMQELVRCHFCGSEKVNENDLCYGCGICICVECVQKYPAPSGKHRPEDHKPFHDDDLDDEEARADYEAEAAASEDHAREQAMEEEAYQRERDEEEQMRFSDEPEGEER